MWSRNEIDPSVQMQWKDALLFFQNPPDGAGYDLKNRNKKMDSALKKQLFEMFNFGSGWNLSSTQPKYNRMQENGFNLSDWSWTKNKLSWFFKEVLFFLIDGA